MPQRKPEAKRSVRANGDVAERAATPAATQTDMTIAPDGHTVTVTVSVTIPGDGSTPAAARLPLRKPGLRNHSTTDARAKQMESIIRANGLAAVRAEHVIECMPDHELFCTPMGEPFITMDVSGHQETWPVQSPRVRRIMRACYRNVYDFHLPAARIDTAMRWMEADALTEPTETTFTRVGQCGDEIYLDLCNDAWQAIRITPDGWQIVDQCPVRFVRHSGMQVLPMPLAGGSIDQLRPLLNLPDDDAWILIVSWIFGTLSPAGAYPLLVLSGEHDSAKSSACRMARQVIDPSATPLRSPPRDEEDLIVAAQRTHILGYDNLSTISPGLSDSLCRVATGGALGARRRHKNREEVVLSARRPIVLNGIGDDLVERDDLCSRCIMVRPPSIPKSRRLTERALRARFSKIHPHVLGAFLNAAVTALRRIGKVDAADLPRMADFATWVIAGEPALPWKPGQFREAYERNISRLTAMRLEGNPLCRGLRALMQQTEGTWSGTAEELYAELYGKVSSKMRQTKAWPARPITLRGDLTRLAPSLRSIEGIDVQASASDDVLIITSWTSDPTARPELNGVGRTTTPRTGGSRRPGNTRDER